MIRSQKKNFRFDIWALYQLYESLTIEINKFQLSKSIMNKILDWERSKLKICRYTLDSNYRYRIVTDEDKIIIQHSWHNYLFDADYFSRITNNFISNQSIEYTLGNIFDTIVLYVMNNNVNLNNSLIFNMLVSTYPYARFNSEYFNYISEKCTNTQFTDQIRSRILLQDLLE